MLLIVIFAFLLLFLMLYFDTLDYLSGWFILLYIMQAYMYGFFKNKRIVLYDTLIQQVFNRTELYFSFLCLELLDFFSL